MSKIIINKKFNTHYIYNNVAQLFNRYDIQPSNGINLDVIQNDDGTTTQTNYIHWNSGTVKWMWSTYCKTCWRSCGENCREAYSCCYTQEENRNLTTYLSFNGSTPLDLFVDSNLFVCTANFYKYIEMFNVMMRDVVPINKIIDDPDNTSRFPRRNVNDEIVVDKNGHTVYCSYEEERWRLYTNNAKIYHTIKCILNAESDQILPEQLIKYPELAQLLDDEPYLISTVDNSNIISVYDLDADHYTITNSAFLELTTPIDMQGNDEEELFLLYLQFSKDDHIQLWQKMTLKMQLGSEDEHSPKRGYSRNLSTGTSIYEGVGRKHSSSYRDFKSQYVNFYESSQYNSYNNKYNSTIKDIIFDALNYTGDIPFSRNSEGNMVMSYFQAVTGQSGSKVNVTLYKEYDEDGNLLPYTKVENLNINIRLNREYE